MKEQLLGALIASIASMIIAFITMYIYFRKEKQLYKKLLTGDIEPEKYKDYELVMVSGKQLKDLIKNANTK